MTGDYSTGSYQYIHLWVKPLDNADWIEFYVTDWSATNEVPGGQSLYDRLMGDSDEDGKFEVGVDLVAGRWNELWLDVNNVDHLLHTWVDNRNIKEFGVHTNVGTSNNPVEFLWDHVYATDEPYKPNYFHNDYLGSARVITDASGNVQWSRDYYPFGSVRDATGTENEYKFTGKEWDEEIGLFNYWHRYYDPVVGRFIQVDPKWDKYPALTPFQYAANNPLKYVDPDGRKIRFAAGVSQTFKEQFAQTIKYLNEKGISGAGALLIYSFR